jgi:hypothetical protein
MNEISHYFTCSIVYDLQQALEVGRTLLYKKKSSFCSESVESGGGRGGGETRSRVRFRSYDLEKLQRLVGDGSFEHGFAWLDFYRI